ncbi:hypothetical protein BTO28_02390 [Domibacillus epiphyticus]|uniref:Uncharacterized protein n=1 Tax=Domibacillus epiphyticus TaxID=1714355 RepID=A0A1V2ABG8_9BACI|nr:hypothetical protein BTO28_02390 [Domibacillus epiphyticus]
MSVEKMNLKHFYNISTFLFVLFAGGFLVSGIGEFQHLGWPSFVKEILWDTSKILNIESEMGHLFHSLFGYTDRSTMLQVTGYIIYLAHAWILITSRRKN